MFLRKQSGHHIIHTIIVSLEPDAVRLGQTISLDDARQALLFQCTTANGLLQAGKGQKYG